MNSVVDICTAMFSRNTEISSSTEGVKKDFIKQMIFELGFEV